MKRGRSVTAVRRKIAARVYIGLTARQYQRLCQIARRQGINTVQLCRRIVQTALKRVSPEEDCP